jgi:phosphatidylserine/phosphatidylglycerophosphate/cardiolipin synthase-like enzyme
LVSPFPFVDCHQPQLFCNADETWQALLGDLASARESIRFENYILRDSKAGRAVIEELVRAADRGVAIRVHIDGLGSMPIASSIRQKLETAGVVLRIFNDPAQIGSRILGKLHQLVNRTHRRIVVIDTRIGWIGGIGISDRWWPGDTRPAARDTMLRFSGPLVAQALTAFDHLWHNPGRAMHASRIEDARPGEARVVTQYAPMARRFRTLLYSRLKSTKRQIWMATPYFIPSHRLRRVLRHAARMRLDVRLLLPGPLLHDHPIARMAARRHYSRLLQAGVRIFEYQPAFFHSKIALFDDEWVVVGSANLDRLSFFTNHELVIEARHQCLAKTTRENFERDFISSQEIHLDTWLKRPLAQRFLERAGALFERFL